MYEEGKRYGTYTYFTLIYINYLWNTIAIINIS